MSLVIVTIYAILVSCIEGYREFLVYTIDLSGGFPRRDLANIRKAINAALFMVGLGLLLLLFSVDIYQFAVLSVYGASVRWIVHDGLLNVLRDLPFFRFGTVSKIDKLARHNVGLAIAVKVILPPLLLALSIVI